MNANHDHTGNHHDHRSASRRSLSISLALIMAYMVVEVVGGLVSGSLALLADAGHMLTDGAAIGLALLAIWVSGRPASIEQTFGFHRTEILAAMLNALSLWFIAALIFFEASRRFDDTLDIDGGLMLGVGAVGLLVNMAAAWVLHRSSGGIENASGHGHPLSHDDVHAAPQVRGHHNRGAEDQMNQGSPPRGPRHAREPLRVGHAGRVEDGRIDPFEAPCDSADPGGVTLAHLYAKLDG